MAGRMKKPEGTKVVTASIPFPPDVLDRIKDLQQKTGLSRWELFGSKIIEALEIAENKYNNS